MTRTRPGTLELAQARPDIAGLILQLRGQPVIVDSSLAALFGVTTKRLNEQVRRNARRFPDDFVFRLTATEALDVNRSQFATGSQRHRDPKYRPLAFTEHGAIMAANVLRSKRAIETSVFVVRAFVQLRRLVGSSADLATKLAELEARIETRLRGHDKAIAETLGAIRRLMGSPVPRSRPIGFTADFEPDPHAGG
jgi:hypothetical protein